MGLVNDSNQASAGQLRHHLENGVKDIKKGTWWNALCADDIIQNRVKHTEDGDWLDNDDRIEEIIENGVKQ